MTATKDERLGPQPAYTTITVRLPQDLKDEALKAAEISDTSLTRFVRRALRNEIKRTKET